MPAPAGGCDHEMMFLLRRYDSSPGFVTAGAGRVHPAGTGRANKKGATLVAPCPGRKIERGTGSCPLPEELEPGLDDVRVVAEALALAVDLHVVERELEVLAPVPVHARGHRVHPAAFNGAVVQVDGVVAQAHLPHAAGRIGRLGGAGGAGLVAPRLAGQVVDGAEVAAGGGVVSVVVPADGGMHVLALQFQRAMRPETLDAGGG